MRLLIADDHPVILSGLTDIVRSRLGWSVQTASSTLEVVRILTTYKPDILFTDIIMPNGCVFEVIKRFRQSQNLLRVILYSGQLTDHHIRTGFNLGVSGILTKAEPPEEIVKCLEKVAGHGVYYSPYVADRMLSSYSMGSLGHPSKLKLTLLSQREMDVLKCIGSGDSNPKIARKLNISVKTVNRHKSSIMDKLETRSSTELMKYALREGITPIHEAHHVSITT